VPPALPPRRVPPALPPRRVDVVVLEEGRVAGLDEGLARHVAGLTCTSQELNCVLSVRAKGFRLEFVGTRNQGHRWV
jgi:hypothetical protein